MSQRNLSQNVSEVQVDNLASDTLRYLLGLAHTKLPVKRQDIIKNVLKDYSKHFKTVMERTKTFLNEDYGIDMVEVCTSGGNKSYILTSQFRHKDIPNSRKFVPESMKSQQILLMIVLSFIFMKGGAVKEDVLSEFLVKLGLKKKGNNFVHECFGDVPRLVSQDFVRQLYLEYRTVPNTDPPRHEYVLGKRTELEVSYRGLLEYISSVYGSPNIQIWSSQYEAVLQQEYRWLQQNGAMEQDQQKISRSAGGEVITSSQQTSQALKAEQFSQASNLSLRSGRFQSSQPGSSQISQNWSQPGPSGLQSRGTGDNSNHRSGTFLHPSSLSQTRLRNRSDTSAQGPLKRLRS